VNDNYYTEIAVNGLDLFITRIQLFYLPLLRHLIIMGRIKEKRREGNKKIKIREEYLILCGIGKRSVCTKTWHQSSVYAKKNYE